MGEDKRSGAWHLVKDLWIFCQWLYIGSGRKSFKPTHLIHESGIRKSRVSFAASSEHNDLFVLEAGRLGQTVDAQLPELLAQQPCAFSKPQLGNDKDQHATCLEPAVRVFEKYCSQPGLGAGPRPLCPCRIRVVNRDGSGLKRMSAEGRAPAGCRGESFFGGRPPHVSRMLHILHINVGPIALC